MFEYHMERNGEEAILHCIGNLSVRETVQIKAELLNLKDRGVNRLIFDFAKLSYLDSSGIGILLHAYTWTKEKKGTILIRNMSKEVKTIFTISNLMDIFRVE